MSKAHQQDQQEAITKLRGMLKPGDTVYTIVNSVAKSGMSRRISLYVPVCGDTPAIENITWEVAHAFGEPVKQRGAYVQDAGLWVSGCGMDMCFATVYNLGRVLFPEGFGEEGTHPTTGAKVRPGCRENAAGAVDLGYQFRGRNGDTSGWDNDGGYALNKKDL